MARPLTADLDAIQTSITGRRSAYKVEIFDVRSTVDTIGFIVRELTLQALTGPRDFTADVESVTFEEVASDYNDLGLAPTTIMLRVTDPNSQFDPFLNPAPLDGRWLRRGNVVRITEGDDRVPENDWVVTFTGELQGQAGVSIDRNDPAGSRILTMAASDRMAGFLKFPSISDDFAIGVTYLFMINDIATTDMAMDSDEINLVGVAGQTAPWPVQFVDEPPMVSIARLMQPDGFIPKFDGNGKLTQTQGLALSSPDRTYFNDDIFVSAVRPFNEISPANSVLVIGLDGVMSEVEQPQQPLAELTITTGFFTQDETVDVFWSDDHTLLAKSVSAKKIRSVNGGLTALGAGENFTAIAAPAAAAGASIGFSVEFTTGFAPWLIIFLVVTYIVLSWIPDTVVVFGFIGSSGFTINVGASVAAIALGAALIIMTMIGRGVYSFQGIPFEFVFKEIKAIAEIAGTLAQNRIRIEVENHLITTQANADQIAADVLLLEQAKGAPRNFTMIHDLRLEPNDVFQTQDLKLFLIQKISRTIRRGVPTIATVEAFDSTQTVAP